MTVAALVLISDLCPPTYEPLFLRHYTLLGGLRQLAYTGVHQARYLGAWPRTT